MLKSFKRSRDLGEHRRADRREAGVSRRGFLGMIGGATALTACTVGSEEVESNLAWQSRVEELKANNIYSRAVPGIWAGKEGTHVPKITDLGGGLFEASCTHGMAEGHWITTIFVEDERGNVLHLQELMGRGPGVGMPVTTFRVPPGVRTLTAYTYCNLHDCWSSDPYTIGA
jgi:desulfoferrodoxin (superoxide reductase-like protein)